MNADIAPPPQGNRRQRRRKWTARRLIGIPVATLTAGIVVAVNVPTIGAAIENWYHHYEITRPAYEAKYGHWVKLNIPAKFRVNGIQSTLLYNGDVLIMAANRAHAIPVIVAYNLPGRDACGKLSASAGPAASAYETWVNQLAAAIGTGDDIVIVEPDGLPDAIRGCLSPAQSSVRFQLLRYAMRKLGGLPHARVYLDAGNPGMFRDPSQLSQPLEKAGLRYGRGFSANVSNFQWTGDVVTWSQHLERALGGKVGAVIDTSRNGRGPYSGPDNPQWCNPPGRALGPAPRLDPGPAGIDAYLWIKDPGASDGPCNGGPPAGQYWPQYAAELAQASHSS
jgi:endoglucanase